MSRKLKLNHKNWYGEFKMFSFELLNIFIEGVESQIKSGIKEFYKKKETVVLENGQEGTRVFDIYKNLEVGYAANRTGCLSGSNLTGIVFLSDLGRTICMMGTSTLPRREA